jgi:predicted Rossmann fold flavoprotein
MYDVIIIGAGPSGMMAAIQLNKRGFNTLIIDKNNEVGKKLKLTGGGRCNLTNLKNNNDIVKHIHNGIKLKESLNNFSSKDIFNYFTDNNVLLVKEDNDRIFTKNGKSNEVIEALRKQLNNIILEEEVINITKDNYFIVTTNKKEYKSKNLVIATGGKSYPNTGSTGDGYTFAKLFNHKVTKLYPAEVYLETNDTSGLAGISLNALVSYESIKKEGQILFTHKGLSGPAILNISEYISKNIDINNIIIIDLLPSINKDDLIKNLNNYPSKNEIKTWLKQYFPIRLVEYILKDLANIKIASISNKNKEKIINDIKEFKIPITKTGSFEVATVTSGGIDLSEVNENTFESKLCSNLYFCGEVLDFNGEVGGYNLTIAFSTGYTVGISIKKENN